MIYGFSSTELKEESSSLISLTPALSLIEWLSLSILYFFFLGNITYTDESELNCKQRSLYLTSFLDIVIGIVSEFLAMC